MEQRNLSKTLLLAGVAVLLLLFYLGFHFFYRTEQTTENTEHYNIIRAKNYKFIAPIYAVEPEKEGEQYVALKKQLQNQITTLKQEKKLERASIYLRDFDKGDWMGIDAGQEYHPASLMKVALLLFYLKIAEGQPGLLKEKWKFEKPAYQEISTQYYNDKSIEPGKTYTVHDLLYYMIAYSDNNATYLLSQHFDPAQIKGMFTEFNLPIPVADDQLFTLSARDCAMFFKVIYNASFLGPEYSEYAAELLSNCTFKKGFASGFPDSTSMWHKFGEYRYSPTNCELHEAGVVFVKNKAYLLAIMTAGDNTDELANSIKDLSNTVYKQIAVP